VLDEYVSKNRREQALEYIQQNMRTGKAMGKVILVRYRDTFLNDGSLRNKRFGMGLGKSLGGR
jgi:hypothetical protein